MPDELRLVPRLGRRPATTPTNPHQQLDQQPATGAPRQRLMSHLADLPGVTWTGSAISVPGAIALTLRADLATGPPAAFMIGTEFAHLHPTPDHSLHLILPTNDAAAVVEAGWAEQHPIARLGLISPGAVMVYAPRDDQEADLVAELVRRSHAFATGAKGPDTNRP